MKLTSITTAALFRAAVLGGASADQSTGALVNLRSAPVSTVITAANAELSGSSPTIAPNIRAVEGHGEEKGSSAESTEYRSSVCNKRTTIELFPDALLVGFVLVVLPVATFVLGYLTGQNVPRRRQPPNPDNAVRAEFVGPAAPSLGQQPTPAQQQDTIPMAVATLILDAATNAANTVAGTAQNVGDALQRAMNQGADQLDGGADGGEVEMQVGEASGHT